VSSVRVRAGLLEALVAGCPGLTSLSVANVPDLSRLVLPDMDALQSLAVECGDLRVLCMGGVPALRSLALGGAAPVVVKARGPLALNELKYRVSGAGDPADAPSLGPVCIESHELHASDRRDSCCTRRSRRCSCAASRLTARCWRPCAG
jgi:hypothetical protein